jgi:uncharacterized membrane protein
MCQICIVRYKDDIFNVAILDHVLSISNHLLPFTQPVCFDNTLQNANKILNTVNSGIDGSNE